MDVVPISDLIPACEQDIQRARENLDKARQSEAAGTPRQLGATDGEIQERTALLQDVLTALEQRLKALRRLKTTRDSKETLERDFRSWDGFPDPASVRIDLVDSLRDTLEIRRQDLRAASAELALVEKRLPMLREAFADAERGLLRAQDALNSNKEASRQPLLQWQRDLAALRLEKARAERDQASVEKRAAEEARAFHQRAIEFVQMQLQVATQQAPFSSETLKAKLEGLAAARLQTEKELANASKKHAAAMGALEETRKKLAELRDNPDIPDTEKTAPLEALRAQETRQDALAETARSRVEVYELLLTLIAIQETLWQQRFDAYVGFTGDAAQRADALERARNLIEATRGKLIQPKLDLEANARRTRTLISAAEERVALLPTEEPELAHLERMLEAYYERGEVCRLGLQRISDVERLLDRWTNEVAAFAGARPWWERLWAGFRNLRGWVGSIWQMELLRVGDTIVSIDKMVTVFLIIAFGVFFSRRVARRIRRFALEKLRVEEGVAIPAEMGVFYILLVLSVLFALSIVRIPLTVFAYLGGALAIGVGFGAQNIIANFISGIIMLLERPIKIGDIVEVDGVFGIVRKIGGRCSQLRRFDGIDMLIPNSSFLEKNVINWTLSDRKVRFSVTVGVAYGSPTREVERILRQAIEEHPAVLREPPPVVLFEDFGESALVFTCYFWIELLREVDSRIVRSELRHRITELFREAGITIAFPQQDVHLDVQKPLTITLAPKPNDDQPN